MCCVMKVLGGEGAESLDRKATVPWVKAGEGRRRDSGTVLNVKTDNGVWNHLCVKSTSL